jgi:hypothetical protein
LSRRYSRNQRSRLATQRDQLDCQIPSARRQAPHLSSSRAHSQHCCFGHRRWLPTPIEICRADPRISTHSAVSLNTTSNCNYLAMRSPNLRTTQRRRSPALRPRPSSNTSQEPVRTVLSMESGEEALRHTWPRRRRRVARIRAKMQGFLSDQETYSREPAASPTNEKAKVGKERRLPCSPLVSKSRVRLPSGSHCSLAAPRLQIVGRLRRSGEELLANVGCSSGQQLRPKQNRGKRKSYESAGCHTNFVHPQLQL